MVGATVGRYRLVEKIGAGGMGDVFRAVDPATNAVVAIKILNAIAGADAQRFVIEARAVNRVPHEGVVKVIEVAYIDGGRPYLVMELLEGKSLEAAIVRQERPSLALMDQVLTIVAAAHSVGIVHRDLKPGNIWLSNNGRVRVLDFGVAKLLDENAGVTRTGAMVGTPMYMSPEQVQGTPVDARADLYAIGVMAFELATGKRPYDAPSAFAVAQKHVQAPIPRLPAGSHPAAQPFIDRALAKLPKDRFASADEMRAALGAWLGRTSSPSLRAIPAPSRSFLTARSVVALGAATLVSVGLIVAAVVSKRTHKAAAPVTASVAPVIIPDAAVSAPADAAVAAIVADESLDPAIAGLQLDPKDPTHGNNDTNPVYRRWNAMITYSKEQYAKPMLGTVTKERTANRDKTMEAMKKLGKTETRWSAIDEKLTAFKSELDTWGTASEFGYTRGGIPIVADRIEPTKNVAKATKADDAVPSGGAVAAEKLPDAKTPFSTAGSATPVQKVGVVPRWISATDPENPYAKAITLSDDERETRGNYSFTIEWMNAAVQRDFVGPRTEARVTYRIDLINKRATLAMRDNKDWAAAKIGLREVQLEIASWGTAREKYATGTTTYAWDQVDAPTKSAEKLPPIWIADANLEKEVQANFPRIRDLVFDAQEIDYIGPPAIERTDYRREVKERLMRMFRKSSYDYAAARKLLIDTYYEVETWGTAREKYATGTQGYRYREE